MSCLCQKHPVSRNKIQTPFCLEFLPDLGTAHLILFLLVSPLLSPLAVLAPMMSLALQLLPCAQKAHLQGPSRDFPIHVIQDSAQLLSPPKEGLPSLSYLRWYFALHLLDLPYSSS